MKTKHIIPIIALAGITTALTGIAAKETAATVTDPSPVSRKKPRVQIALLLDTSNSMDGLISQAKTQLWKIVNEFADARQDGHAPSVEVALYEYGNNNLSVRSDYIRQVLPLTTDLDTVSEKLFGLRTNGGQEYCGAVISHAAKKLEWDMSPRVYKAIFIAGNEPFTQGGVKPEVACSFAAGRGVIVNTIHCGSEDEGVRGCWKTGAELASGKFMNINQDAAIVHVPCPQDDDIRRLGVELNRTYLPYGAAGAANSAKQEAQDKNALAAPAAAVERARTKSTASVYQNESWDLVDAFKDKSMKLRELKESELPPALKGLNMEEREALVAQKAKEREAIQAKIQALCQERDKFAAARMKEKTGESTLDVAVIAAVREQAAKSGFAWAKK